MGRNGPGMPYYLMSFGARQNPTRILLGVISGVKVISRQDRPQLHVSRPAMLDPLAVNLPSALFRCLNS